MNNIEPYILERIEAAKDRAKRIIDGVYDDEESLMHALRWRICREYNWGFFDHYFDKRTLDDLAFEVELIKLSGQTATQRATQVLASAPKEEKEELFSDWNDMDAPSDSQFEDDAKKFMTSGEFKK